MDVTSKVSEDKSIVLLLFFWFLPLLLPCIYL
jgi:hypothetical protein